MLQLLSKFTRRKRAYPRSARRGIVLLFSGDRLIGRAELVDESEGGACIRAACGDRQNLRYVLNPSSAQVTKVRPAWEAAGRMGLEYVTVMNIRGYVIDPEIEHVRNAWRTMAFEYQNEASRGAFAR